MVHLPEPEASAPRRLVCVINGLWAPDLQRRLGKRRFAVGFMIVGQRIIIFALP